MRAHPLLVLLAVGVVLLGARLLDRDSTKPASVHLATGDASDPASSALLEALLDAGVEREAGTRREDVTEVAAVSPERGRVVRGRVLDEHLRPVAGLRLAFYPSSRPPATRAVSAEDGRFETGLLPIGKIGYIHEPEGSGPFRATWIPPGTGPPITWGIFELPAGEGAFEQDLVLRASPAILDVLVLDEDGEPAPEMSVQFVGRSVLGPDGESRNWLRFDAGYEEVEGSVLLWDLFQQTDETGRTCLGLWPMNGFLGGELSASTDSYEKTSLPQRIETPYQAGLRTLRLEPSGGLSVVVRDPDGTPRTDLRVWLRSRGRYLPVSPARHPGGIYDFKAVPPGICDVYVDNPWSGETQEEHASVDSGVLRTVEVDLLEGPRRVAFEGRIVSEDGQPLEDEEFWCRFSIDGGVPDNANADGQGRLAEWAYPGETVTIRVALDPEQQVFEPLEVQVSFGARGVTFRRTEKLPEIELHMVTILASTKERTNGTWMVDRGESIGDWTPSGPERTRVFVAHPDLRWRAMRVGTLEASGRVADQVDLTREGTGSLRAELVPGFALDVQVIDGETDQPLAGVAFSSDTAPRAVTNSEGRVRLEADHWPVYRYELAGYEPERFDPAEEFPGCWTDPILALWPLEPTDGD